MLLRRNRPRRPADLIDVVDETGGTLTEPAAREVEAIYWFHSIDLGNSMVTPGAKSVETQLLQLDALNLPDLSGKRVLDIGGLGRVLLLRGGAEGSGPRDGFGPPRLVLGPSRPPLVRRGVSRARAGSRALHAGAVDLSPG